MKAIIALYLKDDNSFRGIFDGSPLDFSMMLHQMAKHSIENKSAIYLAVAAMLKDDGDEKTAEILFEKIRQLNPEE